MSMDQFLTQNGRRKKRNSVRSRRPVTGSAFSQHIFKSPCDKGNAIRTSRRKERRATSSCKRLTTSTDRTTLCPRFSGFTSVQKLQHGDDVRCDKIRHLGRTLLHLNRTDSLSSELLGCLRLRRGVQRPRVTICSSFSSLDHQVFNELYCGSGPFLVRLVPTG